MFRFLLLGELIFKKRSFIMDKPVIYALLLGINRYSRETFPQDIDLQMCVYDCQRFEEMLLKINPEIIIQKMTNEECTKVNVEAQIVDIANAMKAGDELIVYQSSHGTFSDTVYKGNTLRMTGVVMHDSIWWDYERLKVWRNFKENTKVKIITAACHSESSSRSVEMPNMLYESNTKSIPPTMVSNTPVPTMARPWGVKCQLVAVSSCRVDETSKEITTSHSSSIEVGDVFTTGLLQVLTFNPKLKISCTKDEVIKAVNTSFNQRCQVEYIQSSKTLRFEPLIPQPQ